ncbi:MAG: hypothetical protein JXQ73_14675 [Phycisphaerae bacterium]|nr:hypothetical protein [Phycisphaerae bacterium]
MPRLVAAALLLATSPAVGEEGAIGHRLAELEEAHFAPKLAAGEIDRLLGLLCDPATRVEARNALVERGQGHQDRIIRFARRCADVEARQACAEVVEGLDASYRTVERGKELCELYRAHTESLFPSYWAAFRKNALDVRAVAMVVSADPEWAYGWLAGSEDRHDQTRFLLLRIRELTPDTFAAERIFEHTGSAVMLGMRHVCPYYELRPGERLMEGCDRIVGHVMLNALEACVSDSRSNLPELRRVVATRRRAYIRVGRHGEYISDEAYLYENRRSPARPAPLAVRMSGGSFGPVCPMPILTHGDVSLTFSRNGGVFVPSSLRPYVPCRYRERLKYRDSANEAFALTPCPETATAGVNSAALASVRPTTRLPSSTGPTRHAIVILPPQVSPTESVALRSAAEIVCDRLSQELSCTDGVQVLDRAHIDRLLGEKKAGTGSSGHLTSYDAMVRLEIRADRIAPRSVLRIIDLSTGNVIAEHDADWPIGESEVPAMVEACRRGLESLSGKETGKLKVRVMEPGQMFRNDRLLPFVTRLDQLLKECLSRSSQVLCVRHIEAGSSKEESLLLMMGLSRLPGGRHFAPQADAVIGYELEEREALGKTFEETVVTLKLSVREGPQRHETRLAISGTIGGYDALVTQAWEKLSRCLSEIDRTAARDVLDDYAVRRRQAAVEIEAATSLFMPKGASGPHAYWVVYRQPADNTEEAMSRCRQKYRKRLHHTGAAVKLDPTSENARYEHVISLIGMAYFCQRAEVPSDEVTQELLPEMLRYLRDFEPSPRRIMEISGFLPLILSGSPFRELAGRIEVELDPGSLRCIEYLKELVELVFSSPIDALHEKIDASVAAVCGGMRHRGLPLSDRERWLDRVLAMCEVQAQQARKADRRSIAYGLGIENHYFIRTRIAQLAIEDGQLARAKQLLREVVDWKRNRHPSVYTRWQLLKECIVQLDDPDLFAEYTRWKRGFESGEVETRFVEIRWPEIDLFGDFGRDRYGGLTSSMPGPKILSIGIEVSPGNSLLAGYIGGLAQAGDQLYAVVSKRGGATKDGLLNGEAIACLPLDKTGRPLGQLKTPAGKLWPVWDTLRMLPAPEGLSSLRITQAQFVDGELFLGTAGTGLLALDVKTEQWSRWGPAQGLPGASVCSFHPLRTDLVYCAGDGGHFTLDLAHGTVRLLHRSAPAGLRLIWQDGQDLVGIGPLGVWRGLRTATPEMRALPREWPYGWSFDAEEAGPILSGVRIESRCFYACRTGLFEIDANGELRGRWGARFEQSPDRAKDPITLPPESPINFLPLGLERVGSLLLVWSGTQQRGSVLYDPAADTWYGPLSCGMFRRVLGTSNGMWFVSCLTLGYIHVEDFMAEAKRLGRVMSTSEYERRKREFIQGSSPLDQAKFAIGMRRLPLATALLKQALADHPDDTEALTLLALIHLRWGEPNADEVLTCCRRLEGLIGNADAVFTGMYLRTEMLAAQGQVEEARAVAARVRERFQRLEWRARKRLVDALQMPASSGK